MKRLAGKQRQINQKALEGYCGAYVPWVPAIRAGLTFQKGIVRAGH
uniref:Uncharacterized protein n=1 Tax=Arundo donax TaxID=35708 RepID=A0A0A9B3Y4_ARUDO